MADSTIDASPLDDVDATRLALAFHLGRIQYPQLSIAAEAFVRHTVRAKGVFEAKSLAPREWSAFLGNLYAFDWLLACGCLEGLDRAWDILFRTRTGRSDCLLVDALRARSCRLYPRDAEKQERAVQEFWGHLIVSEIEGATPILLRYDGQRPLAPWLIRVFQNWHLSNLRKHGAPMALPDDDLAMPQQPTSETDVRWNEAFCEAAYAWLNEIDDQERLILGLRWRYQQSQRDVAQLLGVHEGTVSRQTDKLRDRALALIGQRLIADGWTGDDLEGYILTEMAGVMLDDPRLSADHLQRLLRARGKKL